MKNLKAFETKLNKATALYDELKEQDLSLDVHLKKFKEAKKLITECRAFLEQAEMEIMKLVEEDKGYGEEDFDG